MLEPILMQPHAFFKALEVMQNQRLSSIANELLFIFFAHNRKGRKYSRSGIVTARLNQHRLLSDSCSRTLDPSAALVATICHRLAVAFHFARCGQLTRGLSPPRVRPCWAHHKKPRFRRVFCCSVVNQTSKQTKRPPQHLSSTAGYGLVCRLRAL
jgi:hypothetical protein